VTKKSRLEKKKKGGKELEIGLVNLEKRLLFTLWEKKKNPFGGRGIKKKK